MGTVGQSGKRLQTGQGRWVAALPIFGVSWGIALLALGLFGRMADAFSGGQESGGAERTDRPTSPAVDDRRQRVKRFLGEVYCRRDGAALMADVWVPEGSGPVPAVLLIHGGAWTVGTRWQMLLHAERLVEAGFATVSIDYRLAPRWKYPAQIEDCREAWRWMSREADRFGWDKERMAVYGYSAGAHLALLLALDGWAANESLPRPKAVVAGGAPCSLDWLPPDSRVLVHFLGGTRREIPDVYRQASPLTYASADDPPVLLFHGSNDLLVPLANPRRLKSRLEQLGVPCELAVYSGLGHLATFLAREPRERAVEFLAKFVRNSGPQRAAE